MLKKSSLKPNKVTKNALFFLLPAPTHHSFTIIYAIFMQSEAHEKSYTVSLQDL